MTRPTLSEAAVEAVALALIAAWDNFGQVPFPLYESEAKKLAEAALTAALPHLQSGTAIGSHTSWVEHLRCAIVTLKNQDRSRFEQKLYDGLRAIEAAADGAIGDSPAAPPPSTGREG